MIAYKQMPKVFYYIMGILCPFYLTVTLGCTPDSPTRVETIKERSMDLSSQKTAGVAKKNVSASDTKANEKVVSSPVSEKISLSLRLMIEKMETLGITKDNAEKLEASSLTTPLVKVNDEGSIQTYVHVETFGFDEKALLEAREVVIEIANEKLGIIQAWIPFDQIYEVAELPFVKHITPPSYDNP